MNQRKLQPVINRIEDDVNALKYLLKRKYKKREQYDLSIVQDQYGHEVIFVDVYHIDLEIDNINGSIEAYEDVLKRLNMLKESIK